MSVSVTWIIAATALARVFAQGQETAGYWLNHGASLELAGDYSQAEAAYRKARVCSASVRERMISTANLAYFQARLYGANYASRLLPELEELAAGFGDATSELAATFNVIGSIYLTLNRDEASIGWFKRSLAAWSESGASATDAAPSANNLALAMARSGHMAAAKGILRDNLRNTALSPHWRCLTEVNLAWLLALDGDASARELMLDALKSGDTLRFSADQWIQVHLMASYVCRRGGDRKGARHHAATARQMAADLRRTTGADYRIDARDYGYHSTRQRSADISGEPMRAKD